MKTDSEKRKPAGIHGKFAECFDMIQKIKPAGLYDKYKRNDTRQMMKADANGGNHETYT